MKLKIKKNSNLSPDEREIVQAWFDELSKEIEKNETYQRLMKQAYAELLLYGEILITPEEMARAFHCE